MDMALNYKPQAVEKIHLIAVCGTGMGALACMLKDMGYAVTGSDQNVYPPMSDFLADKGVTIHKGFEKEHIAPDTDLVVVGNAVSRANPEARHIIEAGLPFCSMPQAINWLVAADKAPLLVTGTHGKTTTSSMIAWMLDQGGLDPSFFVGGISKNYDSNYRLGQGSHLVVEGDEYDTAFFDKGPKFLHYRPQVAVLTGVEFDHADIFTDLDHVKQAFDCFLAQLEPGATLIACHDAPNVRELIRERACRVQTYGLTSAAHWRLDNVKVEPPWSLFDVVRASRLYGSFRARLVGEHNLLNALAAIAVGDTLGLSADQSARGLETFLNARRRQEVRGTRNGITVMDDFAHHPTAVRETVRAVRPFYPAGRLIAVFEPRTNSSMRDVFQSQYAQSFDEADIVCVRHPPLLEKIPAGERFSSEKLVADLAQQGKAAHYFEDTDAIIAFLVQEARRNDLVLIMSNGGFDNIHARLLDAL